jgi:hypothetical protein
MSIPLDRLYHFIDQTAREIYGEPVLIYRFWPNGSKNITDLNGLYKYTWIEYTCRPSLWCNDQEPLDHDHYSNHVSMSPNKFQDIQRSLNTAPIITNLNHSRTIFRKSLLLHSEKRSNNVEKYIADDELIPVYYWSHAVIARDWFRYAGYENFKKNVLKSFLIYNRAWTGTREYRLRFSDLLIEHGLADQCLTFCNPVENGQHYRDHTFVNPAWRPQHVLEHYFQPTTVNSSASADFCTEDYSTTEIEIVLETLFDDDRLHLTEKSLRPIACGQPFILAATHGSLQYLRDYGFKTFDTVWDESYDMIQDPYQRMLAIIEVMRDVSKWSHKNRNKNFARMDQIARFNQKYFFSDKFQQVIISELKENLTGAFEKIRTNPGFERWIGWYEKNIPHPEIQEFLITNQDEFLPTKKGLQQVLDYLANYSKKAATR